MKNNKNIRLISEMKETLAKGRKGVLESLVFDDDMSFETENDTPGYDVDVDFEETEKEETPSNGTPMKNTQQVKTPEVKSVIDNIRRTALQGIQQIADNPTSAEYDVLKKIWQLCDKAVDMKQPDIKE